MPNSKSDSLKKLAAGLGIPQDSISVTENEFCSTFPADGVPEKARLLKRIANARLVSIAATDDRKENGTFGLRMIFSLDPLGIFVTLRAELPQESPQCRSIAATIPAAHAFERENWEFFGIFPSGHPDLKGLLLHADWPSGSFPLRKDFTQGTKPERAKNQNFNFLRVEGKGVFEAPVGPVHAGIIEPGHFRFSVAGEPILHLEIQLGFAHKGIEKLAEGQNCLDAVRLSENVSGDASFSHSLAFCQAVERVAKVQAPKRAEFLRVVWNEMERLYNHLGDIAGIATDVGFPFGAAHALRLRELVLQKNLSLTGHRLLRGINVPGGVRNDLDSNHVQDLRVFLKFLFAEYEPIERLFFETDSLMDRVEGTGAVSRAIVTDLGGVGPAARASGVDIDLRRDHPYGAYSDLKFNVPVREEGDVAARMLVKMAEIKEAIGILHASLDRLPEGPIATTLPSLLPAGSALGWSESARGEIVHWLKIGSDGKIARLKIKSPSFSNWPLLSWAVRDNIVPDFPLINKSFNLSYSGNDR